MITGSNKFHNNMNNNNVILTKLNELNLNIIKLNDKLENAASKSEKFEQFMIDQSNFAIGTEKQITLLSNGIREINVNTKQLDVLYRCHENCLFKVIVPVLNDIIKFMTEQNQKNGNLQSADVGKRLETFSY
ncbi:unnamed protein product [Didymodactylos carnosus]|uniref:Uncharacterized protein n=1 Tax=Didymodactylos carnosus TaxID=1234261 RepID=A0A8S2V4G5_9BILA|nr:unnamed protein product [Didymodactylos carnosus]